jgi:hypothetical protein
LDCGWEKFGRFEANPIPNCTAPPINIQISLEIHNL